MICVTNWPDGNIDICKLQSLLNSNNNNNNGNNQQQYHIPTSTSDTTSNSLSSLSIKSTDNVLNINVTPSNINNILPIPDLRIKTPTYNNNNNNNDDSNVTSSCHTSLPSLGDPYPLHVRAGVYIIIYIILMLNLLYTIYIYIYIYIYKFNYIY